MEIERKFLIRELPPDLDEHPADRIAQGYLAAGDDGVEVRVRRRGGKAVLTVKQGSGLERVEEEVALGKARFERLWPLTEGRRIEKVRHVIPHGGLEVELDVYGGSLAGLTVAEVEFASREDADAFVPPPWFGEEVTGDARFANRRLAVDGIPRELTAFELAPDESAAAGLWRIARGRFDRAIGRLEASDGDELGAAVHGARKDLKRLRAVVRLARDEVGDATYRRENAALRDTGRRLSGARDSQVMVETLDALTERYADDIPPDAFSAFRAQLASEHAAAQRALRSGAGTLDSVRDDLRGARGRAATWAADLDGVQGLTTGFERVYRRGRKAAKRALADRSDEPLHELRKRVKDLWYTAEVLRPAAPKTTKQLAKRASDLSDVIGEDHDLAVLSGTAERHADRLEPSERDLLAALIERRRSALQADALKEARRLYARKPKATARRIGLRR